MKSSLFSVSYAGYWGQESLELSAFLQRASELGYRGVMLAGKRPHLSPLDANADRLAMIQNELKTHRLECTVIAGYTDFAATSAAEVPYLEMQIQYVETLARMAKVLSCSVVRIFTAYDLEGSNHRATWNSVVRCCAGNLRPRLSLRRDDRRSKPPRSGGEYRLPLGPLGGDRPPQLQGGVRCLVAGAAREDLYEAARKMAPHTAITTNADYVKIPRFRYQPALVNYARLEPDLVKAVKFGEGFIDYQAFFAGLKDGGFDGIANYEMCSPIRGGGTMKNLDQYAAHYIRWMREHVGND